MLGGQAPRDVLEVGRVGQRRVRGDLDARTERRERPALVERHLLGHHAHEPVAARARDEREPDARVAGGRLDDRVAGAQDAPALGVEHDRERDAVLDAAARVEVLALDEHRHVEPGRDRPQRHERRIADLAENARRALQAQAPAPS